MTPVHAITGFALVTQDSARLRGFYQEAFDARTVGYDRLAGPEFERLMGISSAARREKLIVGESAVELLQFDEPGRPYPRIRAADQLCFQHFALVVSDMTAAVDRLRSIRGWTAISVGGPEQLPARSGGVTAFKFRDPEGHPLELLEFPRSLIPSHWQDRVGSELFCGIDHTAIGVADTDRSRAFFASLGWTLATQQLNEGPEQERLDGVAAAQVEVSALTAPPATPHLELLCYRTAVPRPPALLRANDVAATCILTRPTAAPDGTAAAAGDLIVVDPDGHRVQLRSAPRAGS